MIGRIFVACDATITPSSCIPRWLTFSFLEDTPFYEFGADAVEYHSCAYMAHQRYGIGRGLKWTAISEKSFKGLGA